MNTKNRHNYGGNFVIVKSNIYFDELLRQIILEETDRDKVHQTFSGIWSGKLMNYCIFVYDLRYVSQKNITV